MVSLVSKFGNYSTKQIKLNRLRTPNSLIHFVTNKCNFKCSHCFYWKEINKGDELSLNQIEKVISSLKEPIESLMLTGGEPFLREDLVDICELYYKINKTKNINIATNGFLTENIIGVVNDILNFTKCNLHIQVSLDDFEEEHDKRSNVKGAFKNAINTLSELKKIKNKRLSFNVLTVISNKNYKNIKSFSEFLITQLGVTQDFELVRRSDFFTGKRDDFNPMDDKFNLPPYEELENLYNQIKEIYRKQKFKRKSFDLNYVISLAKIRLAIDIIKKKNKIVSCPAGSIFGVIYPGGDVSVCELLNPVGNLKNFDFDFYKLWNSSELNMQRTIVKNCFCTHGCFLQSAIYNNPFVYSKYVFRNIIKKL